MVDKLHYKCLFQDVRFTVYGLFTIDSSLSYMVSGEKLRATVQKQLLRTLSSAGGKLDRNVPGDRDAVPPVGSRQGSQTDGSLLALFRWGKMVSDCWFKA